MNTQLAPIVLFTYNRPEHTKQILNSLSLNEESKNSVLYVFCDGAKENASLDALLEIEEVRKIIHSEKRFKEVKVTIQEKNKGLANSIIDGVSEVVNKHGKVIVLEDDLIVSPYYLAYMNDSLERYEFDISVGQIGACNFFACGDKFPDFFFLPIPDCWGWATWKNRWESFNSNATDLFEQLENDSKKKHIFNAHGSYDFMNMLQMQIDKKVNSWAIRWQAVCVLKGWLTLYPNPSMTNHVESTDATHANVNVIPPMVLKTPNFHTFEVKEIPKVIKAFRLGYSGNGDYFGNRKKQNNIKILKKCFFYLKKVFNYTFAKKK